MHIMHDGRMTDAGARLRWLPGMDVNLLIALDGLLREAHVTRAARRVGLSQSAMSHALARLRRVLDDPLLVRTSRGMTLSPRAQRMAAPLAEALAALDGVVGAPAPFEPRELQREFRIAAIDCAQLVIVPALQTAVAKSAPGVELVGMLFGDSVERGLADGSIDLAIGLRRDAPSFGQIDLLLERFVCVVRQRRRVGKTLSVKRYAAMPHVLVSPRGRVPGAVDTALKKRGLTRKVV